MELDSYPGENLILHPSSISSMCIQTNQMHPVRSATSKCSFLWSVVWNCQDGQDSQVVKVVGVVEVFFSGFTLIQIFGTDRTEGTESKVD